MSALAAGHRVAEGVENRGGHRRTEKVEEIEEKRRPMAKQRLRKPQPRVSQAPQDQESLNRPKRRVASWKEHGKKHIYVVACYDPIFTPDVDEMRLANGAYSYRWEIYVEREQLDNARRGRRYFLDTNWEDAMSLNHWVTGQSSSEI